MHMPKSFFAASVAALFAVSVSVSADDTEAQMKAREALRKKMEEGGQTPAPVTPAAPEKPKQPVAEKPKAPSVTTPPAAPPRQEQVVAPPVTAPRTADSEAVNRAREAMRQKMQQLEGQPAVAPPPAVVTTPPQPRATPTPPAVAQPAPSVAPAPQPQPQPATAPVVTPSPSTDAESLAKARDAMRKKMDELQAHQPTPVAAPTPTAKASAKEPAPTTAAAPTTVKADPNEPWQSAPPPAKELRKKGEPRFTQEFTPMPAPPSALSGTKDSRLAELLRKYRADEITPEQYHRERAKILAEP